MKNRKRDDRPKLQRALQRLTAIISVLMLFMAGVSLSFKWGVEIVSLFTIAAYFFGLTYATLQAFFASFGTKLFGASFLALFTAPLIVYSIVVMIGIINEKGTLFVIADSRTWIIFAGSVIGGLMTMLAMYFSIKSSENTTKQQIEKINDQVELLKKQNEIIVQHHKEDIEFSRNELAVQSIPTIVLQIAQSGVQQNSGILFSQTSRLYIDKNIDISIVIPFQLRNLSKYPAREQKFKNFSIFVGDTFIMGLDPKAKRLIKNINQEINKLNLNSKILPGEYSIALDVDFEYKPEDNEMFKIEAELEYFDYLQAIKHTVQMTVFIWSRIIEEIRSDEDGDLFKMIEFSISDIHHEFKN